MSDPTDTLDGFVIEPVITSESEAAAVICGHKIINDLGYEDHANFHGFVQEVLSTTVGAEIARLRRENEALVDGLERVLQHDPKSPGLGFGGDWPLLVESIMASARAALSSAKGDLPSVNWKHGQPYSYCPECGRQEPLHDAEIARLRREKDDDSPGTPLGRLGAIAKAAEERGLCKGIEAKAAEVFLIEAYDRLRREKEALVEVLRDCPCPRPANAAPDGLTVEQCMARLECGCDWGDALRSATETVTRCSDCLEMLPTNCSDATCIHFNRSATETKDGQP